MVLGPKFDHALSSTSQLPDVGEYDAVAEEKRRQGGTELGTYLSYVKIELDSEASCLELPLTIILLASFSCLALMHLKQDKVYTVEGAIKFDIIENANFAWSHNFGHKTIFDVNNIADFWSWFRIGFLPLVVQHSWSYSESLQDSYNVLNASHPYDSGNLPGLWQFGDYGADAKALPARDDYLHYNRIIGGIRLRQERAEMSWDSCRVPGNVPEELWKEWLGKPCMPASPNYEMHPEVGEAEAFGEPKRIEWFVTSMEDLAQMQRKSIDMEDGCQQLSEKGRVNGTCFCSTCMEGGAGYPWIDEQTQRVEIGFITFNSEYGLLSLTTVNLFFSRGGMIHKFVHVESSWSNHFAGDILDLAPLIFCDATWLILLLYVVTNESKEVIRVIRASSSPWYRALQEDYIEYWNIVDWVSAGLAGWVVTMFIMLFVKTGDINSEFESIAAIDMTSIGQAQYVGSVSNFFASMEGLMGIERWYRSSFCFYPIAVMLRLFKSFSAQGRLAVVTRTLSDAAPDMAHFFIVFFAVYFCLTVNSMLLFGQDIAGFATLDRAILSCFRALFGDFDWGEVTESSLLMAAMWFWIFVLVMSVTLLNFLLAILMDAYAIVKENSKDELTLMSQIETMMRRRGQNKNKERVKLNKVWDAYSEDFDDEKSMLKCEEVVSPADVMERVEGIPASQAKRTLANAIKMFTPPTKPYTQDRVMGDLKEIDKRSKIIRNAAKSYCDVLCRDGGNDPDFNSQVSAEALPDGEEWQSPGVQIVETVRDVITKLGSQVSGVLSEQLGHFAERQRNLESQHRDMLACMKDTHRTMQDIRQQMDEVGRTLRSQAMLQQRQTAAEARAKDAAAAGMLGGCAAPTQAPAERIG
mmetsp:Transcript_43647/g.78470  ORF Transcript_43647/g.78470 Transcript_43647/m.78470 type:complete len:864 (-) Transcript_43647:186-2777(-)